MCVWVEDADKLEHSSKELKIVYYNRTVKSYLNSTSSSLGLAGVKGQGKTFLIKVKRNSLEKNKSIICFPRNKMVDTIDSSIEIDRSLFKYLRDYNIWVNLWKYAICCSILSFRSIAEEDDLSAFQPSQNTKNIIKLNKNSEPSLIMSILLSKNIQELEGLIYEVGKLIILIRGLNRSICFFIDKLDQGFSEYAKNFNAESVMPLRSRNASFWQYAQYSLAEAAYDIYNVNQHIKVFFTIRHEALIDAELLNKDKARNINAFITKLEYSKADLKEMYDLYIKNEAKENLVSSQDKGSMPSKAFIGLETIPHGYVENINENVFDYIFRHTFKRPYDMMKICHALYLATPNKNALTEKELRQIVNQEASDLLDQYLQELSIFMPCPIEEIDRLLAMTPGNVLNQALMNQICNTHYTESTEMDIWKCNQKCDHCRKSQVFTVLFNIGLIGYYKDDPCDTSSTIAFENIGNRILDIHTFNLPQSSHYYLHPALSDKARDIRGKSGLPFFVNYNVVVGDSYEVDKSNYPKIYKTIIKEKRQIKKERVFVSSTIYDLKEERAAIKEVLYQNKLHPVMSEASEFDIANTQHYHSHDVCLKEIVKCKSFLFVIGEKYGGIYSGEDYCKERDEIVALSHGKVDEPSISLMEFYIARKHNLNCFVFARAEIEEKKKEKDLDIKLTNEINFINHFRLDQEEPIKGNWINWYSDIKDLTTRIMLCKFI